VGYIKGYREESLGLGLIEGGYSRKYLNWKVRWGMK
jgi:hypothetical protein